MNAPSALLALACLAAALAPPSLAAPPVAPPTTAAIAPEHDALRARLADARRRQIEGLRLYAAAGRFPKNHRVLGEVPVFVDPDGARCAVAWLMDWDGQGDAVQAIARADNHVYVEDVIDGPLAEWVLGSGLLLEEAAMIQPGYPLWTRGSVLYGEAVRPLEVARLRAHFEWVIGELTRLEAAALETAVERALAAGVGR